MSVYCCITVNNHDKQQSIQELSSLTRKKFINSYLSKKEKKIHGTDK